MPLTTSPPVEASPGWYSDPTAPNQLRYWDGASWTQFTGPSSAPNAPERTPIAPTEEAASPLNGHRASPPKRPFWKRRWVIVTAGLFFLLMVVGALSSPSEDRTSSGGAPTGAPAAKRISLTGLSPADGATIRGHSVVIQGSVSPATASVMVDGESVALRAGHFRHRVSLDLGLNEIAVSAEGAGLTSRDLTLDVTRTRTAEEQAKLRERRRQREEARAERRRQRALEAEQQRQAEIAAATKTFSGSGSKNIGSITVDEESVLEWTNTDDPTFRQMLIYDDDFGISVTSGAASGDTVVPPGTYPNITVAGGTSWTLTIHPR